MTVCEGARDHWQVIGVVGWVAGFSTIAHMIS